MRWESVGTHPAKTLKNMCNNIMSNRFFASVLALAGALTATCLAAGVAGATERGSILFRGNPGGDASEWKVDNYKDRLQIVATNFCGVACAYVTLTNEGCNTPWKLDTAFAFTSRRFSVTGGRDFAVAVRARGTYSMRFARGARSTFVRWYGADGRALEGNFDFAFDVLSNRWFVAHACGRVPAAAAEGQLVFGADSPNVRTRQYLALADVAFADYPAGESPRFSDRPVEIYGEPPSRDELALADGLIDERGFPIVDGRPFFPIGIFGVWKKPFNGNDFDRAFKGLRDAGFNLVQTYNSKRTAEFDEFLDAAERHGFKVMTFPGASGDFKAGMDECIARERGRACHLAWYLADDTSDAEIPVDLRDLHLRCHRLDPTRLTAQADSVGTGTVSKYAPYVDSTDVYLPEIYPVAALKPDGKEVPKVILDMKMIAADLAAYPGRRKSVWPIIQHFKGWKAWLRFPTFAELRAMSYQAIIHGANGITWYTYVGAEARGHGVTSSPERWREMSTVSREIAALAPDLVCPNAPNQPVATVVEGPERDARGFPSVSCLLKDSPRGALLLAGNSSTNAVRARFSVSCSRGAEVLFESGRELPAAQFLADDFAPCAVHVYRLR